MSIERDPAGPTFFLVAGEDSGDLHASHLVTEIRGLDPSARVVGLGGSRMAAAGAEILYPLVDELAVMGLLPVLAKLPKAGRILDETYDRLDRIRPDALVLVDYPGFNLYLARYARRHGIPVLYYIVPQLWAWGHWRLGRVRRRVDRMLVIFPFEEDFYRSRGIDARFVGHPLVDELTRFRPSPDFEARHGLLGARPIVGLLPGSRSHEIEGVLPIMVQVARRIREAVPGATFLLALARAKHRARVERLIESGPPIRIVEGETHEIQSRADLCLVTSGTATVETAYFRTPMVVLYRIGRAAAWLARSPLGIKTRFFGMVNILADREVAPEFLMVGDESEHVARTAIDLLADGPARTAALDGLGEVHRALTSVTGASRRAAEEALAFVRERRGRP